MKMKFGLIFGLLAHLLFAGDAPAALQSSGGGPHGSLVLAKSFDPAKRQYGITAEYQQYYSQVKFQQVLTQELMAEGYTVVERLQIAKVLGDIVLDLGASVKGNDRPVGKPEAGVVRVEEDKIKKELSKEDLKRAGQTLGISYMIFFNMETQYANLRIVNLETAEIVATASIDLRETNVDSVVNRAVAKSFVKALSVAANIKRPIKRVYFNYYDAASGAERALEEIKRSDVLLNEEIEKYGYAIYDKNEK